MHKAKLLCVTHLYVPRIGPIGPIQIGRANRGVAIVLCQGVTYILFVAVNRDQQRRYAAVFLAGAHQSRSV
jgi:hypothetical protein